MKKRFFLLFILALALVCNSCTYRLALDGASIPPEMKTVNVMFFENTAPLVVNNLSQLLTESLKDRIRSQTKLSIVRGEADGTFEGQITGYSYTPAAIQATTDNRAPIAGLTRLTITVRVKYTNIANKKLNFDQTFTRFKDFSGDASTQEQALIIAINQMLTEDIFNAAFASW